INTAQDIKRASGIEEVVVNRVADTEFANVLFTIGEEVDTDLWSSADVTATAVVPEEAHSEGESEEDLIGADILVDVDEETGEFVPAVASREELAIVEVVSPGLAPPDAPPVSDSESEPEQATALGQPSLLWPPRIFEGYPCPILTSPDFHERGERDSSCGC
ncbi:MAG: hypothetical protein ACKPKO_37755, partial [Candidatus Fonsibacter sp.]